ncbi:small permease component of tripartite tricarboxylate transporter [Janthinobacterium sp. Marseille]|nr:tripartite tricarboxylate transporter TctB family protein [Janthinobacterium sp. Marseille]ABR90975.1 small permease component of tripartite tricarboxylate transporter [Janthinobacterium sp. Marseille]
MAINKWFNKYNKDYYGGALMMLIGLAAAARGFNYKVGTLEQMGSGFMPVVEGVLLALVGGAIALQATRTAPAAQKTGTPQWRGWLCIVSGLIAFVILGEHGGLLPASFALVFISALGDRNNKLKDAFLLALALMLVSVVVFWWALSVQFPLLQWS